MSFDCCSIFRSTLKGGAFKMLQWNGSRTSNHIREKSFSSHPTLNGSVLRSIILENIRKAYYSKEDNIEKRILNDENEVALISTARKLGEQLDMHGIEYAIVGGFALNVHGFKRQTLDVDVLLNKDGLNKFHSKVVFNGFVPRFRGAQRSFRDPTSNVAVDVVITGEYPGDGKQKNISFPDPSTVSQNINGLKIVNLHTLINLKLASYMSMPQQRMRDRTDVSSLIKFLSMDGKFASNLHKDVVDEFHRIVEEVAAEDEDLR